MKRVGWWRLFKLWRVIRQLHKIARKSVAADVRCSLCGHQAENHDRRGCRVHDADGPWRCPRDEQEAP